MKEKLMKLEQAKDLIIELHKFSTAKEIMHAIIRLYPCTFWDIVRKLEGHR